MANSAAVLSGAAALLGAAVASCALPAAAQGPMLGSQVMDVRAGAYRDSAEQDDGYAEPARSGWSYSHTDYADGGTTVTTSYREHHSYHSATYLGWAGRTVVDEGGYDGRMIPEGGCPSAVEGERVIRCRYIPFERPAPTSDEVGGLDLYTEGGAGGYVSGGGGGGVIIDRFGRAFAGSSARSSSFASASASGSVSIEGQVRGGGRGGGWSGGGRSSGGGRF